MSLYLITAPAVDVVTVAEANQQLRISGDDTLVAAVRDAAVAQLDPAAGGWLGRALRPQTWELRLPGFPCGPIELDYPPLISITSVKYDDTDGVEQTLSAVTDYRIFGQGTLGTSSIAPPYEGSWPTARCDRESVRVRWQCGYEATPSDTMPATIKQAVHLALRLTWSLGERSLFESARDIEGVERKEWVVSDAAKKQIKDAIDDLLTNLRVY